MRYGWVLVASCLVFLACACAERASEVDDRSVAIAISDYGKGQDLKAFELLAEVSRYGQADQASLANALLSDMYMSRARVDSNPEMARRSIEFDQRMGPPPRRDLAQYRSYRRAVSLTVLGQADEARKLLEENCGAVARGEDCMLIPQFAHSAIDAPRYEAEAIFWITETLLEQGFRSDQIVAANLAALVRHDYPKAQGRVEVLRKEGELPPFADRNYCLAVATLRAGAQVDIAHCHELLGSSP
jgi:hypothetical protein